MRSSRLHNWSVRTRWLCLIVLSSQIAGADFNPRGRQRKAKPNPAQSRSPKVTPPAPTTPQTSPQRSSEALIARYTGIVLSQPGAVFPLQRLSELYRERDGNIEALVKDFSQRLQATPNSLALRLALAWLYSQDATQRSRAVELLEDTARLHPRAATAAMALADLHEADGEAELAKRWLTQALPLLTVGAEREQILRRLRTLALDGRDLVTASKYHEQLVTAAQGSFFVRSEFGRELLQRGLNREAEDELQRVVNQAAGDNRTLAPALRDLAKAQAALQNTDQALKTINRALRITSAESGLRRELLDVMIGVYRDADRVSELIAVLEKEGRNDFARLRLLGSLYEETGRIDEALKAYRSSLRLNSRDLDAHLKVVRLLELQGDLQGAIKEYRSLIQASPGEPLYVFQLVELLLQRGERKTALNELQNLTRRSQKDPHALAGIVDFYERIGESEKAVALLEQVAQLSSSDPQHLIELGGRYFAQGEEERAVRTWQRLLNAVPNQAKALHLLGEVYLEHDMSLDALEALAEAVELAPDNFVFKKSYALALERTGAASSKAVRLQRYSEAQKIWESLLGSNSASSHLAREARQHIVTLWSLQGSLQDRVAPLQRAFTRKPPQLAAGRMLAEVHQRLNQTALAEQVLRRVVELAPADLGSFMALERVLVSQRKLSEATKIAERLVQLEPKRARDHYQRLSKYATDLYRDEDAIEYAAKAVALSPDDATGHKRLADMYRRRQDIGRAIAEYRKALAKNERLFPAYFDLAELLLSQSKVDEADQLLRKVMRSAVDDELIARATRLSSQLHVADNTLDVLEQELLPLALSHPHKPIYRTLLVELYGSWAFPLIQQLNNPDPEQRADAQAALAKISQRAVKPLLDALGDDKSTQQRVAIELLTHLHNDNATLPLYVYAVSDGNPQLRARAMLAAGASGGAELTSQLNTLLFKDGRARVDEADPVAIAAVWAFTRSKSPTITSQLFALLESDSPTVQALALLSLGQRKAANATHWLMPLLGDSVPVTTRAAAAFAAGEVKAESLSSALHEMALTSPRLPRAAALTALARMKDASLPRLAAQALLSTDTQLRRDASTALGVYISGNYVPRSNMDLHASSRIDVQAVLESLLPDVASPDTNARALVVLEPELTAAAPSALVGSDTSATVLANAFLADGKLGFAPLTDKLSDATPENRSAAVGVADRLVSSLVPVFVTLSNHPSADVRVAALRLLGSRREPAAIEALGRALGARDESTVRTALTAIAEYTNSATALDVVQLLDADQAWPLRRLAAQTLHRLAPAGLAKTTLEAAVSGLRQRLETDPNAFVREAALHALVALAPNESRSALEKALRADVETRVRDSARSLLKERP